MCAAPTEPLLYLTSQHGQNTHFVYKGFAPTLQTGNSAHSLMQFPDATSNFLEGDATKTILVEMVLLLKVSAAAQMMNKSYDTSSQMSIWKWISCTYVEDSFSKIILHLIKIDSAHFQGHILRRQTK